MHSIEWNSDTRLGKRGVVMVRLENVIDTRTGQFHSVAVVKERNVKYFVEAEEEDDSSDS